MFTFHSEAVCLTNLVTPFHKCLWSIIYLEPNATAALFVTYFETEATCVMSRKIAKEQMKTIFRIECCTHIAYTVYAVTYSTDNIYIYMHTKTAIYIYYINMYD